jgi:HEPN domain-containing protein
VCFHCQQCAEKHLKALLEELGLPVPKTHDCIRLLTVILPYHASLRPLRRGLAFLTNFAVAVRYPGDRAKKREAQAALRWASRVRSIARAALRITSRPRKRKSTR